MGFGHFRSDEVTCMVQHYIFLYSSKTIITVQDGVSVITRVCYPKSMIVAVACAAEDIFDTMASQIR